MSRKKKRKSVKKGCWTVTFNDGTKVKTGYYPNPKMAVGEAMKKRKGKVRSVKYKK